MLHRKGIWEVNDIGNITGLSQQFGLTTGKPRIFFLEVELGYSGFRTDDQSLWLPFFLAKTARPYSLHRTRSWKWDMQSSASACSRSWRLPHFLNSNRFGNMVRTDSSFRSKITSWFSATRERQGPFRPPSTNNNNFHRIPQRVYFYHALFQENSSFKDFLVEF